MILDLVSEDGTLYRDLVIIKDDFLPVIILHVGKGIVSEKLTNVVLTARDKRLYEYHKFKIIWR